MTLRVEQGKGSKDRYAMLPPLLLERLRAWWRVGHAQGKILPGGWLFPGLNPTDLLSPRQLNRAIHFAADAARTRQARVDAHAAPLFRVREYAESAPRAPCRRSRASNFTRNSVIASHASWCDWR